MIRKIQKSQKSLYAIIPKGIIEHFGLMVGDRLDFRIEKDRIVAKIIKEIA